MMEKRITMDDGDMIGYELENEAYIIKLLKFCDKPSKISFSGCEGKKNRFLQPEFTGTIDNIQLRPIYTAVTIENIDEYIECLKLAKKTYEELEQIAGEL